MSTVDPRAEIGPAVPFSAQSYAKEHPLQVFSAAVAVLATFRLLLVSRGKPVTMAALIEHSNFSAIGISLISIVWQSLLLGSVYIAARLIGQHYGDRRLAQRLFVLAPLVGVSLIAAQMLAGDRLANAKWVGNAGVALFLFFSGGVSGYGKKIEPFGKSLFITGGEEDKWLVIVVLVLAALGFLVQTLGAAATPWHERERLTLKDDTIYIGYVIEDSGRWLTLMLHSDRSLSSIEIDEIESRMPWE